MSALPVFATSVEQFDEFNTQCRQHDWTYNYSDDHSVWRRGSANERRLLELAQADPRFSTLIGIYSQYYFKHQDKTLLNQRIETLRKEFK